MTAHTRARMGAWIETSAPAQALRNGRQTRTRILARRTPWNRCQLPRCLEDTLRVSSLFCAGTPSRISQISKKVLFFLQPFKFHVFLHSLRCLFQLSIHLDNHLIKPLPVKEFFASLPLAFLGINPCFSFGV